MPHDGAIRLLQAFKSMFVEERIEVMANYSTSEDVDVFYAPDETENEGRQ